MITLYGFGSKWGLPDPSPFVIKIQLLLKLAGLPFEENHDGFRRAPRGKLPYLRDGNTIIADSTLIRFYLEKTYKIDFDSNLSPQQKATSWAVEKMLEDHLYFLFVHERWALDENFEAGPAHFFDNIPSLPRALVRWIVRRKVLKTLFLQGTSRYSRAEQAQLRARVFQVLSDLLEMRTYLMGDRPSAVDATAYAFLVCCSCTIFVTPMRDEIQKHPNLVAYMDRLTKTYYSTL